MRLHKATYPLYFTLGALILYVVFFVIPGVLGIYLSFTDWNSYSPEINFVGLQNFQTILTSSDNYLRAITNTVIFTVATIALKTIIGLALALLLNGAIHGVTNIHRVILFLPAICPMLVIGLLFKSMLDPARGVVNKSLRTVGLGALARPWLVSLQTALASIIAVDTWKGVGYIMVILLAGLQVIPRDYYEASEIDGANWFARLRHITIPLLMPAIIVTTVLNLLYGLKVFDVVYVLTNGGPGYATEVVFTAVFKEFSKGRYGVGTAISTILFLVMVVLGFFVIRLLTREDRVRQ